MKTIYQLQQIANRLRQVSEVNSISPEDTFGLQSDVLEYLADMEQNAEGLGIHKVYASYAAMVADASSPVGSNGKALRFGQLVVICNPSNTIQEENGNIYAWQKGNAGDAAWLLIGNLGSVLGNPQNGYYVCDTAAATAEKEISATSYVLSVGGSMKVKMTNANTADNATLNINSTGVKALYYAGERASSINTWEAGETVEVYYDGTSYYANNVAGGSGSGDGAFDVSAKYPTSGVDGSNTYTLGGALAVLNANLSANKKKGGMSIKFIQSSDNKYVQYRLMTQAFSTTESDWQGVDEEPTAGSDNLVKSGGVAYTSDYVFGTEGSKQYTFATATGSIAIEFPFLAKAGSKIVISLVDEGHIIAKPVGFFLNYSDGTSESTGNVNDPNTDTELTAEKDVVKVRCWIPDNSGTTVVGTGTVELTAKVQSLDEKIDDVKQGLNAANGRITALDTKTYGDYSQQSATYATKPSEGKAIQLNISISAGESCEVIIEDSGNILANKQNITPIFTDDSMGSAIRTKSNVPVLVYAESNIKSIRVWLPYDSGTNITSGGTVIVKARKLSLEGKVDIAEYKLQAPYYSFVQIYQDKPIVISLSGYTFTITIPQKTVINYNNGSYDVEANTTVEYTDSNNISKLIFNTQTKTFKGATLDYECNKDEVVVFMMNRSGYVSLPVDFYTFNKKNYGKVINDVNSTGIVDAEYSTSKTYSSAPSGGNHIFVEVPYKAGDTAVMMLEDADGIIPGTNIVYRLYYTDDSQSIVIFAPSNKRIDIKAEKNVQKVDVYIPTNGVISAGTVVLKVSKNTKYDVLVESAQEASGADMLSINNNREFLNKVAQLKCQRFISGWGIQQLVLAHFSDVHADTNAMKNILDWCNKYHKYIDNIIHTGDSIKDNNTDDNFEFWDTVQGSGNILNCIGNHDSATKSGGTYDWTGYTAKQCYDRYLAPYIANWGVVYTPDVCYYYKDYDAQKVRMVVVDCMHFDSTQQQWVADTLEAARTAPSQLSVIIVTHGQAGDMTQINCAFNSMHRYGYNENYATELGSIVDSFMTNGGDFICYLSGHTHRDKFGILTNYPNQLQINIDKPTSDNTWSDHVSVGGTKSGCAFNLVSIDTQEKIIRLVRVGSNYDRYMRHIGELCYRYADYTNQYGVTCQKGLLFSY